MHHKKQASLEDKKRAMRLRVKEIYEVTDQAVFHIVEKFSNVSGHSWTLLDEKDRKIFQKRYSWLTAYLRHCRLGEDCLKITEELGKE